MERIRESGARAPLEGEVLLSCARTRLDGPRAGQLTALLGSRLDWKYLLRQADLHGLTPLLYHHLNATCPESVPEAVLDQLRDDFRQGMQRNLLLTSSLLDLIGLLRTHGISAIPFKGPLLALFAYEHLALREFWDLDLLVRKRDVPKANELLLSQGYQSEHSLDESQQAARLRFQYEWRFLRRTDRLRVEIQWRLAPRYFSFPLDPEGLWERQAKFCLGSRVIPSLAPEDVLLTLCAHGAKHLWKRLIWVCDVAELIRVHRSMDWTGLMDRARETGSLRMLQLGLRLAADLLQAAAPKDLLESNPADPMVRPLAAQVRARLFQDSNAPSQKLAFLRRQLQMRERLRDKARFCVRRAITPNTDDWTRFWLPLPLMNLYYVLRPIRLAGKYALSPVKRIFAPT